MKKGIVIFSAFCTICGIALVAKFYKKPIKKMPVGRTQYRSPEIEAQRKKLLKNLEQTENMIALNRAVKQGDPSIIESLFKDDFLKKLAYDIYNTAHDPKLSDQEKAGIIEDREKETKMLLEQKAETLKKLKNLK